MGFLILIFVSYNAIIYLQSNAVVMPEMNKQALEGERLYQQYNCTSCHQLYGLGGYLGPDLTNVVSNKRKGYSYVKAILNSGIGTMPTFSFTESEKEALTAFLAHVDSTGFYPDRNAKISPSGWVRLNYK